MGYSLWVYWSSVVHFRMMVSFLHLASLHTQYDLMIPAQPTEMYVPCRVLVANAGTSKSSSSAGRLP